MQFFFIQKLVIWYVGCKVGEFCFKQIKYNKIKQPTTSKLDKRSKRKNKIMKKSHKNQKCSWYHIQESHESTEREAMVSVQRAWGRSMQALCRLLQPRQFIWALLGDLAGLVLWGSSIPSFFLTPSSSLPWGSLSSDWRHLMEISHWELCVPSSLYVMFCYGSLFSLASVAWGIFFDDGWLSYWSMSTAEYHYESFHCYFFSLKNRTIWFHTAVWTYTLWFLVT